MGVWSKYAHSIDTTFAWQSAPRAWQSYKYKMYIPYLKADVLP